MKKLFSIISLLSLLSLNIVNATGVSDGVAIISNGQIVITSTSSIFSTSCSATINEVTNTGISVISIPVDSCSVNDSNTLTVLGSMITTGKAYTIGFSSNGYTGSIQVGDITNSVTVNATVLPVLSMSLSQNNLNFGQLVSGTPTTKQLDIVTNTNAGGGVIVSMSSQGLATGSSSTDKYIGNLARNSSQPTTGTDLYQVSSITLNGGTVLPTTDIQSSQNILVANNVSKANTTTTVSLTSQIDQQTEAGNYSDTLVFTITGTF